MDFFKEFSKQFTNVARSVSGATKESPEVARLNGELKTARDALEGLYARYGKASYALRQGRGDPAEAEALAVRVKAALLQVEELAERRDAALALKRCAACGAVHPKEARFCSACGKRLPEDAPKPEPVEPGEYCPNCGARREDDAPRCPVCGADFAPGAAAPTPEPPAATTAPGPDVEEPDEAIE